MAGIDDGLGRGGIAREGGGHRQDAGFDTALVEEPHDAPETDAAAELESGLDVHAASAGYGGRAENIR